MTNARELDALLPPRLRPGVSSALTQEVERLIDGGWTVAGIHTAVMQGMNSASGPGAVIYRLRNLPDTPDAPASTPTVAAFTGHIPCTEHRDGCEVCRCDPNKPTHHRPSKAIGDELGRWTLIAAEIKAILDTDGPGPITYREPDDHPGRLPCLCPDPVPTFALVATGYPIEPGECPLHRAWAAAATGGTN